MDVLCIEAPGFQPLNASTANFHRFIRGIVQKLDLQLVLWIVERGDRIEQAIHDMHFVEHRELDGHQRHILEFFLGFRAFARVLEIQKNDRKTVRAVAGEADQDENI